MHGRFKRISIFLSIKRIFHIMLKILEMANQTKDPKMMLSTSCNTPRITVPETNLNFEHQNISSPNF